MHFSYFFRCVALVGIVDFEQKNLDSEILIVKKELGAPCIMSQCGVFGLRESE